MLFKMFCCFKLTILYKLLVCIAVFLGKDKENCKVNCSQALVLINMPMFLPYKLFSYY